MQAVIGFTVFLVGVVLANPVLHRSEPCTFDDGRELAIGKTLNPDPCTKCTCYLPGQRPACVAMLCGIPLCQLPEVVTYRADICCPICATP
ncbi:hypothetical protein RRG08_020629 [Elysia crispata]|uniref:VWFC domain-containing protein n=1 Tax=Elysia crispata TaxID=231223 RepID=A0AAE1AAW7_9GAST|nr:hypothetical protein RRG08_020629 [Elysia crispata]